jgi:hypothetical protein
MKILVDQFLLLGDLERERERERTPRAVYQIQTNTIIKWVWGLVLGTGVSQRLVPASSSSFDFFFSKFRTGGLSTQ